jgi:pyrroline-5-carboxylate reductase
MKSNSEITLTVVGAGGKMGGRITNNLIKHDYNLLFCEKGAAGIERLKALGLRVTPNEEAIPVSDIVILAVPDAKIKGISAEIVPIVKPDTTIIILDPAAAYVGELTFRDDCTFVVTHPCHPELFYEQKTPEARADMFGGVAAEQNIVIALKAGKEENFLLAEKICREMFAPVINCYRITVEQMATLEPAAAEVVAAAAVCLMNDAIDEAVKHGVPEEAARAFLMGHINIALAIVFKHTNPFSDAAKIAVQYGYKYLLQPDWRKVFEKESIKEEIHYMIHPEESL